MNALLHPVSLVYRRAVAEVGLTQCIQDRPCDDECMKCYDFFFQVHNHHIDLFIRFFPRSLQIHKTTMQSMRNNVGETLHSVITPVQSHAPHYLLEFH